MQVYETLEAAVTLPPDISCGIILTGGRYAPGDFGNGIYSRCAAPSALQPWFRQDSSGNWWSNISETICPEHLSPVGLGDDTAAVQAWVNYALDPATTGDMKLRGRTYQICGQVLVDGPYVADDGANDIYLSGCGYRSVLNFTNANAAGLRITGGTNAMTLADLRIAGPSGASNTMLQTDSAWGLLTLSRVNFKGGGVQALLTATNPDSGGSLGVTFSDCTFGGSKTCSVRGWAQQTNLIENVNFNNCFWANFTGSAVNMSGADAIYFRGGRAERLPSQPSTVSPMLFDNSFACGFHNFYLEDGNNVPLITLGSGNRQFWYKDGTMSFNVEPPDPSAMKALATSVYCANPIRNVQVTGNDIHGHGKIDSMMMLYGPISYLQREFNTVTADNANYGWNDSASWNAATNRSGHNDFQGTFNIAKWIYPE